MSLDQFFKRIDARYRIPRPANALHLDAFQAGFRLMRDAGEGLALVASGFATAFVLWKIADILLRMGVETHFYMMFGMALAVLIGLAEASTLVIPYYRISQRLTHGSARWADVPTLKGLGLAHDNRLPLAAGALRLGRLTHRFDLALPFEDDRLEENEEVIPQDPILFPLIEEWRLGLTQAAPSAPLNPAPAGAVLERINEQEAGP